jgi:outer membrane protein assembly factor BamB
VLTDKSARLSIHHGQWSSPAYGVIDGQAQVIFGGGDGYIYSFDPAGDNGKSKLLWKFDSNPKTAKLELMGKGTRNDIISTPVIYDNKVYVATGQDPEHGEGVGTFWCIDPTKRGDVSKELAFNASDQNPTPTASKRSSRGRDLPANRTRRSSGEYCASMIATATRTSRSRSSSIAASARL